MNNFIRRLDAFVADFSDEKLDFSNPENSLSFWGINHIQSVILYSMPLRRISVTELNFVNEAIATPGLAQNAWAKMTMDVSLVSTYSDEVATLKSNGNFSLRRVAALIAHYRDANKSDGQLACFEYALAESDSAPVEVDLTKLEEEGLAEQAIKRSMVKITSQRIADSYRYFTSDASITQQQLAGHVLEITNTPFVTKKVINQEQINVTNTQNSCSFVAIQETHYRSVKVAKAFSGFPPGILVVYPAGNVEAWPLKEEMGDFSRLLPHAQKYFKNGRILLMGLVKTYYNDLYQELKIQWRDELLPQMKKDTQDKSKLETAYVDYLIENFIDYPVFYEWGSWFNRLSINDTEYILLYYSDKPLQTAQLRSNPNVQTLQKYCFSVHSNEETGFYLLPYDYFRRRAIMIPKSDCPEELETIVQQRFLIPSMQSRRKVFIDILDFATKKLTWFFSFFSVTKSDPFLTGFFSEVQGKIGLFEAAAGSLIPAVRKEGSAAVDLTHFLSWYRSLFMKMYLFPSKTNRGLNFFVGASTKRVVDDLDAEFDDDNENVAAIMEYIHSGGSLYGAMDDIVIQEFEVSDEESDYEPSDQESQSSDDTGQTLLDKRKGISLEIPDFDDLNEYEI